MNTMYINTNSSCTKEKVIKRLIEEGILKSPHVIKAMTKVPREQFVLQEYKKYAWVDTPLPTFKGQTISAIHMVAWMNELLDLKVGHKVLEIGAGSGYHAATIAEIVAPEDVPDNLKGHVYTVEIIEELVELAKQNLSRLNYSTRVTVIHSDGSLGYPKAAPYDRILVTAAAPQIPPPLLSQLKIGGKMVIPLGTWSFYQELTLVEKISNNDFKIKSVGGCVFVPLKGEYGFKN